MFQSDLDNCRRLSFSFVGDERDERNERDERLIFAFR